MKAILKETVWLIGGRLDAGTEYDVLETVETNDGPRLRLGLNGVVKGPHVPLELVEIEP